MNRVPEDIIKKVNEWKQNSNKLVIGIDGYPGAGKTELSKKILSKIKDVVVINIDKYIDIWEKRKKIFELSDNKNDFVRRKYFNYFEIIKIIYAFKRNKPSISSQIYDYEKNEISKIQIELNKPILIIEGIFIFDPKNKIDKLIDKKIYIDINKRVADLRRIERDKKIFGKNFIPDGQKNNWIHFFKKSYKDYLNEIDLFSKVDFVIKIKQ